jgi:threonine/homoserine/homoserine lactone efflux protein
MADLFVTTLLNPKGLIFAFVIFPDGSALELLPYTLVFSVLVVSCGAAWITLGAAVRRSSRGYVTTHLVARASAVVLFGFALFFALSIMLWTPSL